MATYNDYGIVLNSTDLNETDKILNIYTKHNGLVRAVCKGARKPVGRFVSKTDQLSCCYFQFAKGKNLDIVCDLEQLNSFPKLRGSLTHLSYGILFLEVVSSFAHEKEGESSEIYDLLYFALDNLQSTPDPEIFSVKFILDFLVIHGFKPQFETCVSCSLEVNKDIFYPYSSVLGGLLCNECASVIEHKKVSSSVLRVLSEKPSAMSHKPLAINIRQALDLLREHVNHRAKNDIKSFELVFSL